jgi:hypothetical protein
MTWLVDFIGKSNFNCAVAVIVYLGLVVGILWGL